MSRAAVAIAEALESRRLLSGTPNNFVVTDTSGDPSDTGSLPYAVAQANAASGAGTITFDPTDFPAGQSFSINFSAALQITNSTGTIYIEGLSDSAITLSQPTIGIASAAVVEIDNLAISGSDSPSNPVIDNSGNLDLNDCDMIGTSNNGIVNETSGTLVAVNSTIAEYNGAGIQNNGTLTVLDCTIAGNNVGINTTGPALLEGTIVANNDDFIDDINGLVIGSNNLIGDGSGGLDPSQGNLLNADPLLAPLGNYGGPTETMALLPGSPALGAGIAQDDPAGNPILTDQRGIARPLTAPDIGAFQSQGFTLQYISGNNQSTPVEEPFANPLTVMVAANVPSEPVLGGVVNFQYPEGENAAGTFLLDSLLTAPIGSGGIAADDVIANEYVGSYTITANIGQDTAPLTFSLTNTTGTPVVQLTAPNTYATPQPYNALSATVTATTPYGFGQITDGQITYTFYSASNLSSPLQSPPTSPGSYDVIALFSGDANFVAADSALVPFQITPDFTSAASTTFSNDDSEGSDFQVTTTIPNANLTVTPALPDDLTFFDNGNGTADLVAEGPNLFNSERPVSPGVYTLTFTADNGGSPVASQVFTLRVAYPARRLNIPNLSQYLVAGNSMNLMVEVVDNFGDPVTSQMGKVQLSVTGTEVNAQDSTITAIILGGRAKFKDFSIEKAGTYNISAQTIGGNLLTSSPLSVLVSPAAPAKLVFATLPTAITPRQDLNPPVVVKVKDAFGNLVTTAGQRVHLSLSSGPAGGVLGGTFKVAPVNGVATFSDVSLSKRGTYTLLAIHGSLTEGVSSPLVVRSAASIANLSLQGLIATALQPDSDLSLLLQPDELD